MRMTILPSEGFKPEIKAKKMWDQGWYRTDKGLRKTVQELQETLLHKVETSRAKFMSILLKGGPPEILGNERYRVDQGWRANQNGNHQEPGSLETHGGPPCPLIIPTMHSGGRKVGQSPASNRQERASGLLLQHQGNGTWLIYGPSGLPGIKPSGTTDVKYWIVNTMSDKSLHMLRQTWMEVATWLLHGGMVYNETVILSLCVNGALEL